MLELRAARAADASLILALVQELAEYEREPEAVKATKQDILRDGFGSQPRFQCVIAEWGGEPAGFALFFYNYSTWEGEPVFIWKISMSGLRFGSAGSGRRCFDIWRNARWMRI